MAGISRSPGRAFIVIFLLSFAVRGLLLASWMIPPGFVVPEVPTELDRVARTLALTGRYADPYLIPTGATAHPLPLYTGLLAAIYSVFGVTMTAGYLRCLLSMAGYSAMYALIPLFAARLGLGTPAGLVGGLAAAVFIPQQAEEIQGVASGEWLAGIGLLVLLIAYLQHLTAPRRSLGSALALGLGFGLACHLSPAILLVMAGCVAIDLWWSADRRKWLLALTMVVGLMAACAPWAWRNYTTFHTFFFIRSNLGLELRLSNGDVVSADLWASGAKERAAIRHPGGNLEEARAVRALGEVEYMRRARQEAFAWIAARPVEFLRLTVTRLFYFWFGSWARPLTAAGITLVTLLGLLGLWRAWPALTSPQRAMILIPLAAYPLIYYIVAYSPRYAAPVGGILLALAGAGLWHRTGTAARGFRWPTGR